MPQINCDFGESTAFHPFGNDEALAPHIDLVSIACGVAAGDPSIMRASVDLARRYGLNIGAHPALPDREGFGRREMKIGREALRDVFTWQIGALKGFLDAAGLPLHHVRPHGVIYSMCGRDPSLAEGFCDAVEPFGAAIICIAGSETEAAANRRGLPVLCEFFAEMEYGDDGRQITRTDFPVDPLWVADRVRRAMQKGVVRTVGGQDVAMRFQTICLHNDVPNAPEIAAATRAVLDDLTRAACTA